MKKIAILTFSIILNLQVTAQENYKKCLTTSLVEKELLVTLIMQNQEQI